jgi:hypothetical protein
MWSDNESDIDLLQYRYLASAVTRIVTNRELTPSTVGVFGDWGSGKSTLLKMIGTDLAGREGVLCLTFNGWLFEGYDDAKTALMGAILDAISDELHKGESVPKQAETLLKRLLARVNWLHFAALGAAAVIPTLAGHPHATPAAIAAANAATGATKPTPEKEEKELTAEDLEKLVNAGPAAEDMRRSIRDFRHDFEALLAAAKIHTLVVFIDDLDRCLPDTIIETLEAIKLFLFVPGSAFVIAADPRIVQYAVRRRFPEAAEEQVYIGRDYLEKLVQFPTTVSPLSGAEIESYMNLLFAKKRLPGADFQSTCEHVAGVAAPDVAGPAYDVAVCRTVLKGRPVPEKLEEDFDLVLQIAPVLTRGLSGSPRRTKRFLNTLLLRLELAEDRGLKLDRPVLAKLMLLEYFRDDAFRQLGKLQAQQVGKPVEIAMAEEVVRQKKEEDKEEPDEENAAKAAPATRPKRVEKEPLAVARPAEVDAWLDDPWIREWLEGDPALRGIDLRPYFYVSREKAADLDSPLRLSPAAAEVLKRLLDPKKITRTLGMKDTASLAEADATGIFQHLASRLRKAQVLDDTSVQPVLFELMQYRKDLVPQLVNLYSLLPETKLMIGTPALFWKTVHGSGSDAAAVAVLRAWSKAQRTTLANAAKVILAKAEAGK